MILKPEATVSLRDARANAKAAMTSGCAQGTYSIGPLGICVGVDDERVYVHASTYRNTHIHIYIYVFT